MLAYKFLRRGRQSPFGATVWPPPDNATGAPTHEWVVAHSHANGNRGRVAACTIEQLAHWLNDELWHVEIDGDIVIEERKMLAHRGRLIAPVDAWAAGGDRELAAACAWRARDAVVDRLRHASLDGEAGALSEADDLAALAAVAAELESTVKFPWIDEIGLVAEAADEAEHVHIGTAILTAVVATVGWDPAAQADERRWQSRWLAERFSLRNN